MRTALSGQAGGRREGRRGAAKAQEAAAAAAAQVQAAAEKTVLSKTYVEDCGQDTGYWDILYSDGTHEYIDE